MVRGGIVLREIPIFILAAALFLAMGASLFGERGVESYLKLLRETREMEEGNRALERENRRLAWNADALRTQASYAEIIARKDLGMIKPGEIVVKRAESGPE